jgi:hypothetical protein
MVDAFACTAGEPRYRLNDGDAVLEVGVDGDGLDGIILSGEMTPTTTDLLS